MATLDVLAVDIDGCVRFSSIGTLRATTAGEEGQHILVSLLAAHLRGMPLHPGNSNSCMFVRGQVCHSASSQQELAA